MAMDGEVEAAMDGEGWGSRNSESRGVKADKGDGRSRSRSTEESGRMELIACRWITEEETVWICDPWDGYLSQSLREFFLTLACHISTIHP